MRKSVLIFVALFLTAIIVYKPLLGFGLAGDHLSAFYDLKAAFFEPNIASFNRFLNPYGVSALLGAVINWFFGLHPFPYYFAALLIKVIAAFSVYLFAYYLFRSTLNSLIAAFTALILFTGIESVAPGAVVFISIALTFWGLIKFLKYLESTKKNFSDSAKAYLLFVSAFIISPVRMFGLFPLLLLIELLSVLSGIEKIRKSLVRLVALGAIYIFLKNIGLVDSIGTAKGVPDLLTSPSYYLELTNTIGTVAFSLRVYALALIPFEVINYIASKIYNLNLPLILQYLFLLLPGIYMSIKTHKFKFLPLVFTTVLTIIITLTLKQIALHDRILVYLSGLLLIYLFQLFIEKFSVKPIWSIKLLSIALWPLFFTFVPYLIYPLQAIGDYSRYHTASVFGTAIIFGYLLTLSKSRYAKYYPLLLVSFLFMFFSNAFKTNSYLRELGDKGLYNSYMAHAYEVISSEVGDRRNKNKAIIYIQTDDYEFARIAITEGGKFRFSLYNNTVSENSMPLFVSSLEELPGLSLYLDDYYGFEVKNKKVYSITEDVRSYLTQADSSYQSTESE